MNEKEPFSDLENLIRASAPRALPPELRAGILREMQSPVRSVAPAAKVIRFPLHIIATLAAALVLGGVMALWVGSLKQTDGSLSVAEVKPVAAPLAPIAATTHELGRHTLGPVINVDGKPLSLIKTQGVETRSFEDPQSGAVVQVIYPQTSYQVINTPIQ